MYFIIFMHVYFSFVVERRRRDKINNWIVQLSKLVPDCSTEAVKAGQVMSNNVSVYLSSYLSRPKLPKVICKNAFMFDRQEFWLQDFTLMRYSVQK